MGALEQAGTTATRRSAEALASRRIRIGLVGCGDVAHRRYIPTLALLSEKVEVRGCCDPKPGLADEAVRRVRGWSPDAHAYTDLGALLHDEQLDAVINITPAPAHAATSQSCLDAGLHVYSEKPIARSLPEADRLIETARRQNVLLLCAPGVAVTKRVGWLRDIVRSGRLGRLTLAVAHHADTGPATWRDYTGDPTVFYGPAVGPVFDHGVYRLHTLTTLMGPVLRVQAMGAISNSKRIVRAGLLAGQTIDVSAPDHVLMNLEFANGGLGQLLASFAAPNTQAPWLELHFTNGTVSFTGESSDKDAPASIYFDDDSALGLEGWVHGLLPPPPGDLLGAVESGAAHFVACLRGEEEPILTAEHARHVLDIILKAYESIADGQSHRTETTI